MLVQDLCLPLLQQSKELQWFKVFLSPSNLASNSAATVVMMLGISFLSLMGHISVHLPASAAEDGTQRNALQGLKHGRTVALCQPSCRGGDLPRG